MLKSLSLRAKLLASFAVFIVLILICSVYSVVNTEDNIDDSYNIEQILHKSYGRVMKTQRSLEDANNFILTYLQGHGAHENNEQFITDSRGMIENIQKVASVMNENIIGVLPSSNTYKQHILSLKQESKTLLSFYEEKVIPQVQKGDINEALAEYLEDVLPLTNRCLDHFEGLIDEQVGLSTQLASETASTTQMYVAIAIAIIAVIIAILIATSLSAYINKNFEVLLGFISHMEQCDFRFDVKHETKDEFGKIFDSLGKMKVTLGSAIHDVVETYKKFDTKLTNIHEQIEGVASAVAEAESRSVTVSAASDEMVSTTSDIAKNCESAAANASDTQDITQHGVTEVEQVIDSIRNQAQKTQNDANLIAALVQQSNKIGAIVQTIEDIASQTNLLALNAAIEAARAGEAGKGFAVVADEVRALASRSSASTQEITKMVSQIQSDANSANESMVQTLSDMNNLAERASGVTSILNDINDHVDNVNSQISQIATAATQQTTATSEISNNMQGVSNLTQESANSSQESSNDVKSLRKDGQSLLQKIEIFKF